MHKQSKGTKYLRSEVKEDSEGSSKGLHHAFAEKGRTVGHGRPKRLGEHMIPFLVIGVGGFLGANCRYLVGGWAVDHLGTGFPYGTLLINVTGSFIIGLFLTLITGRFVAPPSVRLFFAIGFLGAYTTFSTYMWESLALLQSKAYLLAATNLVGSLLLGVFAVTLGVIVGRLV
jgi:CrcB protein